MKRKRMGNSPMRILHISTTDKAGGAEKMAWELFRQARLNRHDAYLAVGRKIQDDPHILPFENDRYRRPWAAFWRRKQELLQELGARSGSRLSGWLANLGELKRWTNWHHGYEDFDYPGIHALLARIPDKPDVIHLHNLHGNYFDLRAIVELSDKFPVVLTLHDEWAYTGHCAYTFDCERWRSTCGSCPDLQTYPAIRRDGTAHNLNFKRELYRQSRLYIAASSRWLVDRAVDSVLKPAIIESKVIRYGIDLEIFKPAEKVAVRRELGLPEESLIVLFIANKTINNQYKDYATLDRAVNLVSSVESRKPIYFICIGESAPEKRSGSITFRYYGYQGSQEDLARFYQASDLYIHAAKAEAFGLVIAEAMACRLAVVATGVGGIPEVVDDGKTGYLVPPGDSEKMAARIAELLNDDELRQTMAENGYRKARDQYGRERHLKEYLDWYEEMLNDRSELRPDRGGH